MMQLTDSEFQQYSRQIMVPEIAENGQRKLKSATVLIVGIGGLGSAASMHLAGSGIGSLVIADHDVVDVSNLQRQLIYRYTDLKTNKVEAAKEHLLAINPNIRIRAINRKLNGSQLELEVSMADVVLDCTDNLSSRYAINATCVKQKKVLISGAAIGWQGQLMLFDFDKMSQGCYHCLFPSDSTSDELKNCASAGVIGPVVGTIGNLQALEAIKYITNVSSTSFGKLHQFDAISNQWKTFELTADSQCNVCGITAITKE